MGFREDFVWGTATSSYQIEGRGDDPQKGLNIWDVYTKEPGRIYEGHTGDVACDHFHHYREDVAIMKSLGMKAYRFSVDWARVLPEGIGKVNEEGIAFYDRLIDALLENGIEPYLTLHHWELPYELYKRGGWMNPQIVEWFGDFAALITQRFSDRVKNIFTINEPQCIAGLGYLIGIHAPGLKAPIRDTFLIAHHILMAHGRAVQRIRENAKQKVNVGIAPTGSVNYPLTNKPEDIEAARQMYFSMGPIDNWTWNISWWSDPVFFGKYPEEGLKKYEQFLPKIKDGDMELISQPIDIYGQNIYNGKCVRMGENGEPELVPRKPGYPHTAMNWPVTPEALYWGPKFLYERYKTPIYITENGASCADVVSLDGKVHDPARIDFLARYLSELKKAATDGVDIRGYFQWSLLDNFEWNEGYKERFGLVYVDYETQQRILKDSAYWYAECAKTNGNLL